jgi:hypothetical protein
LRDAVEEGAGCGFELAARRFHHVQRGTR